MIDDLNDKVTTAVSAVSGGIWSTREGIMFAGNADRVEEELAEIKEEQAAKNNNAASPNSKDNSLLHVLIVLLSGANLVPLFYC